MTTWKNFIPTALHPYIRLMRLDKPIGFLLVWYPCIWAIILASKANHIAWEMIIIFTAGAPLTRSAGCIINDIFDRNLDPHVSRTKNRPLATGEISLFSAKLLALLLLGTAATLFLFLPMNAIIVGALSIIPMTLYPLTKRSTFWAQLFLGITINWGIWVVWSALGKFDLYHVVPAITLYCGCIFWTLGYDTIYAHQDLEYDRALGLKSTALLLGDATIEYIQWFYKGTLVLIGISGVMGNMHLVFYAFLGIAAIVLTRSVQDIDLNAPDSCQKHFQMQAFIGLLITAGYVTGRLL